MTVGELVEVFPRVNTIEFFTKRDNKFVRHHTVCGLTMGGGLCPDNVNERICKVEILDSDCIAIYTDKDWEE